MSAPEVRVGMTAPVLERRIDLAGMVAYAGATWDWHRMHYDPAFAAERRLPAPVVDGQVLGALLVEQLQDWLGPGAYVRRLSFRFKNLVVAGDTVRCESEVVEADDERLVVRSRVVAVSPDGAERDAVTPAEATVEWRR